jgi:hypothetical protein
MCNIHRNKWHITWVTQPERRLLRLQSCCYNKSCPDPMLSASPRCDDQKPFLNCFRSLLDSPKQCLHIIHAQPSVLLGSRLSSTYIVVVSQRSIICSSRAHVSLILSKYPTWCRSTSSHVIMISLMPSCICHVWLSKRISSLIMPIIDPVWKFLPWWRIVTLNIGIWESSFPFRASAWVAGPRGPSNEARYKQSHEAQSDSIMWYVAHARKKKLHGRLKFFLPSRSSDIIFSPWSMHPLSFFVLPSFRKSRDEISFKGKDYYTPCYDFSNHLH